MPHQGSRARRPTTRPEGRYKVVRGMPRTIDTGGGTAAPGQPYASWPAECTPARPERRHMVSTVCPLLPSPR
ncbi:hypothetical protein [Streptomyces sp. NPDC000994]